MYVEGAGIVYWPHDVPLRAEVPEADAVLIDTATIPGTIFSSSRSDPQASETLEARIGQVTNHVVLENYIVFTTLLNKIFFYRTDFPLPDLDPPEPIELTAFYSSTPTDSSFEIRDIQGSFRSFAIFTISGLVLMGNRAMLDAFHSGSYDPESAEDDPSHPRPTVIPTLQNNSITSIAFGDHHFQALRSDGTIYAYGADPKSCGALGLGFPDGTGPLRGVLAGGGFSADGTLGRNVGRQVWFDPTMHLWLIEMREKAEMQGEAKARGDLILPSSGGERRRQHAPAVMATGDYFEHEGRKWEEEIVEEGGMGSYFVFKVAAAGWHSAALVLVDEEQAERARQKHILPPEPVDKAVELAEDNGHGGTWEDIDAPWDQIADAVLGFGNWIWDLGWWFLGLQARDERLGVERREVGKDEEAEGEEVEVRYTWSEQPFPRLRMADGEIMPGEIEVME
ncbi:MAG: hypothetical protein Q9181_001162 [Wetmoreana brouardii]